MLLVPVLVEAYYNLAQLLIRTKEPDFKEAGRHYRLSVEAGGAVDSELEQQFADLNRKAGVFSRFKFW